MCKDTKNTQMETAGETRKSGCSGGCALFFENSDYLTLVSMNTGKFSDCQRALYEEALSNKRDATGAVFAIHATTNSLTVADTSP